MVLISLPQSRFRQFFFALVVLFAGVSISCFAQHTFVAVNSTPYDKQMARISPVLTTTPHYGPGALSPATINGWINDLYAVPYAFCPQWKTPTEIQSANFADCKGKAVVLYATMRWYGATNLRIVVGKRRTGDLRSHAWLEWETNKGKYLLDPTFNEMVPQAGWTDSSTYIPFYAYQGGNKYRAYNHRSTYPVTVAQDAAVMNRTDSSRAVNRASPSLARVRSLNQSADNTRARVHRTLARRLSKAHESNRREVQSVHPNHIHRETDSPESQTRSLADSFSDQYVPEANWP
jgi:hypothetical protein